MPELHDVAVGSPVGFHKFAEATGAEYDEAKGIITLLDNVNVIQRLIENDEYTVTSRGLGDGLRARYVGPDPTRPGALVFGVIPKRISRSYGRI
jgi:hypothetical protein